MTEEKRKKMSWRKDAKKIRITDNNLSISLSEECKKIKDFDKIWWKIETDDINKIITLKSGCEPILINEERKNLSKTDKLRRYY